jgi:transcriptional regulator with AAA-type ATPase domain
MGDSATDSGRRPSETTESTITEGDDARSPLSTGGLALRWVFPWPPPAPTWIEAARMSIGRDPACRVPLPSRSVSRRHAEIAPAGANRLISDVGSKNGVFVNGQRVDKSVLSAGDVVRIGDFVAVCVRAPRGAHLGFRHFGHGIYGGHLHGKAVDLLRRVASTDLAVLIQGETGTGKERFAHALHELSGRSGPFLAVNAAVYSKSVAAAELFGYRKGAFTGAERSSSGHVRAAEGGTLFLDEVLELPLDVQAMLLRVIENREILPLGETRAVPVDVRFVSAANASISAAADEGRFRADLRARLEGGVVRLPPLRECREIVPELFSVLFEKHRGSPAVVLPAFVERLCLYEWPLNVRQLDTVARRLTVSERVEQGLDAKALDTWLEESAGPSDPDKRDSLRGRKPAASVPGRSDKGLYEPEKVESLLQALSRRAGNVTKAAADLGITRQKAYRMLESTKKTKSGR